MKRAFVLLALLACPGWTFADARGGTRNVEARIISSVDTIRAGESFMVAVALKIAPQWRVYWRNPGETGVPTKITFTLPDSFTVSEVMWPNPEHLRQADLNVYGFIGEVVFLVKVTPPASLSKGLFSVTAQLYWIEAGMRTGPGSATLTLSLPSTTERPRKDPDRERLFAAARAQVARNDSDVRARYMITGDFLELTISKAGGFGKTVEFFPETIGMVVTQLSPKITPTATGLVLRYQRPSDAPRAGELRGVLVVGQGPEKKGFEIVAKPADVKAH